MSILKLLSPYRLALSIAIVYLTLTTLYITCRLPFTNPKDPKDHPPSLSLPALARLVHRRHRPPRRQHRPRRRPHNPSLHPRMAPPPPPHDRRRIAIAAPGSRSRHAGKRRRQRQGPRNQPRRVDAF